MNHVTVTRVSEGEGTSCRLFLPFIFLLTGRWSPRKARQDAAEHQRLVDEEMARLKLSPGSSD